MASRIKDFQMDSPRPAHWPAAGGPPPLDEAGMEFETEFGPLTIKTMWVTPDLADDFLARKAPNRTIRPKHVKFLARQIERGFWRFNGETMIFDETGKLIDGQHRCAAVKIARKPIYVLIVEGVPTWAFDTIDGGLVRPPSTPLQMAGEKHYNLKAHAVAILDHAARGGDLWDSIPRVAQHEVALLQARYQVTDEHVLSVNRLQRIGLRNSAVLALSYLFHERDPELAQVFFADLAEGVGLGRRHPVYIARERVMADAAKRGEKKLKEIDKIGLLIAAWNSLRLGRTEVAKLVAVVDGKVQRIR